MVLNKNTVPGDRSAVNPSGLRVGSPAMTSRGAGEADFEQIGYFIATAVDVTKSIVDSNQFKTLAEFTAFAKNHVQVAKLKVAVEAFATKFETVGSPPV